MLPAPSLRGQEERENLQSSPGVTSEAGGNRRECGIRGGKGDQAVQGAPQLGACSGFYQHCWEEERAENLGLHVTMQSEGSVSAMDKPRGGRKKTSTF